MEFDARMSEPLDDFEPARPVGVDEDVVFAGLDQEGCVADPSHANLIAAKGGKIGGLRGAVSAGKKRGDKDFR